MSDPLHIKYRPKKWEDVVGNKAAISSLRSVLKERRVHSFLFSGPSGCGKTTLARLIKSELNCSDMSYQEINAANDRGIDTVREVVQECGHYPISGKIQVILFDECHRLTGSAGEALLKATEDTPPDVYFIFATTNPEKLLPTLLNRCTHYIVYSLTPFEMKELLSRVCRSENIHISEKVTKEIIRVAEGCPRQALVLLDQIKDLQPELTMLEAITVFTVDEKDIIELSRALLYKSWENTKKVLKSLTDTDPEKVRRNVLGYMSAVVLSDDSNGKNLERASKVLGVFSEPFYNTGRPGLVYACWKVFN
jgi:DNA polymerase-3 subunit gamma/tau